MVTSCVDSGIAGTVSFHSDLSTNCQYSDESPNKPSSSNPSRLEESEEYYDEQFATPKTNTFLDQTSSSIFRSNPSRRISKTNMTSSFYTAHAPDSPQKIHIDHEAELFNELGGECGLQQLSNDEFIAKFVLAEQICR